MISPEQRDLPSTLRSRWVWFAVIALVAAGAATLAHSTRAPPGSSRMAAASAHSVPSEPLMTFVPGGTIELGSTERVARGLYDACRLVQGSTCGADFEGSVFARQVRGRAGKAELAGFYIDTHEVDNAAFAAWLEAHAAELETTTWGGSGLLLRDANGRVLAAVAANADRAASYGILRAGHFAPFAGRAAWPATHVAWQGASAFCQSLGKRLPSEREWEFAARGPEARAFTWGNGVPDDCTAIAYSADAPGCSRQLTAPLAVGTARLDRTPEGVQDLGGNVSEWTATPFASAAEQDRELCAGGCYVVRGASFRDSALWLHGAIQSHAPTASLHDYLGFRCAKSPP